MTIYRLAFIRRVLQAALVVLPFVLPPLIQASGPQPLPSFPVAESVFQAEVEMPEYRMITGRLSVIGNQVSTQGELLLQGTLGRRTDEIPRAHAVGEVVQHYLSALKAAGGRLIYRCEGRDCGRSNDWANQIFRLANLYGLDRDQAYFAGWLPSATREGRVVTVYVVRRGNQRVYAHQEWMTADAAILDRLTGMDSDDGVRSILIDADLLGRQRALEETLADWWSGLQEDPAAQRVFVVSYYRDPGRDVSHNLGEAERQARAMQEWLQRRRVPEDRIRVIVVGPLGEESVYSGAVGRLRLVREAL